MAKNKFESVSGTNWVVGRYLIPIIRRIGAQSGGRVLDLACGQSPFQKYFFKCDEFVRVDIQNYDDATIILGEMTDIPVANDSIDTVLLFQAISDVFDTTSVLTEIKRVLKQNGRLIIFESMSHPEHDYPNDYFRIMPQGLRKYSEIAGFGDCEVIFLGNIFTRFAVLTNKILLGRISSNKYFSWLGSLLLCLTNLSLYTLDRLCKSGPNASDYLAILVMDSSKLNHKPDTVNKDRELEHFAH